MIEKLNFIFFGTDDFSVIVLERLKEAGYLPALMVTAPDRPKGRGLVLTPPPAKLWAKQNDIPILQPEKLDSSLNLKLSTFNFQLFVVASYGLIIPKHILNIPKHGALNVHPSLLPKYRGASPIESQILDDEKEVGVTIMLMDEEMDHGPILARRVLEIRNPKSEIRNKPQNTNVQISNAAKLRKMLAEEGGKLLAEVMPRWIAGEIKTVPQKHSQATYTKKLTKADGEINLNGDPYQNFLKIQAFAGSIGCYFFAEVSADLRGLHADRRGRKKVRVIVKDAKFESGKLNILRVVPEGKKEMAYEEFLRGVK